MFGNEIERVVIGSAIVLWFAQVWYLNSRLRDVHATLDQVLDQFHGRYQHHTGFLHRYRAPSVVGNFKKGTWVSPSHSLQRSRI